MGTQWATTYAAQIAEHMTQALMVTDPEFRVLHGNKRVAELLQVSDVAELVGTRLTSQADSGAIIVSPGFQHEVSGEALDGHYHLTSPFGKEVEVQLTFVATEAPQEGFLVWLNAARSMEAIDNEVFQSEKLAAMDNIVAGVAHELNNPMTAILGYSELLLQSEQNPRRKQRIALITEEADRCAKIIANMLSFTRSFGNKVEMANLGLLLDEVISLRAYQMRVDGIELDVQVDRNIPMSAVQPSAMRRLFLNIVHNAHQALQSVGDSNRHFDVALTYSDERIHIRMSDSGCGIPEDVRYKIFDPFFSTRPLGEGMGLGLSVAYGIVHEHKGKIWMEPRDGGGTTILMEFPINQPT